ncbi:Calcineurin-like phosphoesterase [Chitinophaga costaii]|uniref:Calcineurin-like phosphoesterase n=1 Tax=Chitinophaga costaii TaxID=1335309 RepID=A0A1C4DGA2_9BACT|nr:metallophosphoesterase [Chitinophaga costaii]PUZ24620.1 metallophosphoesterase [Chitinophaga costaii]SCC30409.1 Calcineurin-like phosphoesterase [Chitinophaga costaii]
MYLFTRIPLITAVFITLSHQAMAQDSTRTTYDGPYVFYIDGDLHVQHIRDTTVHTDTLSAEMKPGLALPVIFSDLPAWNFEVPLQTELHSPPVQYAAPEKVLILSDIEGEFGAFRALLLANKVIDEQYNWTFGKGHLVIAGDLFDRGSTVVEYLWLLYKLEQVAPLDGGYVHVILGNHDIMNLSGDFRYVQPKYAAHATLLQRSYHDLYSENTELGRWLRTKNIVEKIGDLLVLHGGVSPAVNERAMSLADINASSRPFYATPHAQVPDSMQLFLGRNGLFWYRGYFAEPRASQQTVDSTLQLYGVHKIVVGHTIVDSLVTTHYEGKVIAVDVNQHEGIHQALLIERGKYYRVNEKGNRELLDPKK